MPMYEYRCLRCEERFEKLVPMRAEHPPVHVLVVVRKRYENSSPRLHLLRAIDLAVGPTVPRAVAEAFADEGGRS